MNNGLYVSLSWLPPAPHDFAGRCREADESRRDSLRIDNFGNRVSTLACYALDENQLARLADLVSKAQQAGDSMAPLTPFCLGVLSTSNADFIAPGLVASAARHGIALTCRIGGYDQVLQEALSPDSAIYRDKLDAVLIAVDYHAVPLTARLGSFEDSDAVIGSVCKYLENIRSAVKKNTGGICILQNFAAPPERLFGSFDRLAPGTWRYVTDRLNAAMDRMVRGTGDVVFDVAGLAETVGSASWHSPEQWNLAKLPFSNALVPLYSEHLARILGALLGKSRRCLVLDLDNVLWGGAVGEDGLEGIRCARGNAEGDAYLDFQGFVLRLRDRGILLAVSSKNDEEIARLPFQQHPEMLLKESHLAAFRANWSDKAANLEAIADELALGLDSFVFLDDDPFERELIRRLLPEVAVPELPSDPALYARTIAAAGYFESVTISNEDLKRASYFQREANRIIFKKQASSIDDYLASLQMQITFQPFDPISRERLAQLINKSNQYNLTGRRYTEAQVAAMESDPDYFTLQARLTDVFGEAGVIGAVICRRIEDEWTIDSWLMSCRVLGRRIEQAVLEELLAHAGRQQIRTLIGIYRPTGRNGTAAEHYSKLGFVEIKRGYDGETIWRLEVQSAAIEKAPIAIHSTGFDKSSQVYARYRELL